MGGDHYAYDVIALQQRYGGHFGVEGVAPRCPQQKDACEILMCTKNLSVVWFISVMLISSVLNFHRRFIWVLRLISKFSNETKIFNTVR